MFKTILLPFFLFTVVSCGDVSDATDNKSTTAEKGTGKNFHQSTKQAKAPVGLEVTIDFDAATNKSNEKKAPGEALVLDLNLPDRFTSSVVTDFKKPAVLPNLFDVKEEEKRVSVGGRLITDPSSENYTEFLKGAEIKVEIKTN